MGTEILVLFMPVPFIFWLWHLWQIKNKNSRLEGLLMLGGGFIFALYMILPITTKQYFMQGLIYTGVLYFPFYLLLFLLVTLGLTIYRRKQSAKSNT